MAIAVRNRFVAFVDLLGVSKYLTDEVSSANFARSVYSLVAAILKAEGFYAFRHLRSNELVEFGVWGPADKRSRLTAISDAFVISVPEFSAANATCDKSRLLQILSILETVSSIQSSLAAIGLLSRGGLSYGALVHTRDVIIGSGLVKAYTIESKRAVVPRTVVDNSIIEMLLTEEFPSGLFGFRSRISHAISKDADGEYYVNYFGYQPIFGGGVIYQRENLERIYLEREQAMAQAPDPRVKEKLAWFYQYVRESLDSYSNPFPYLQCNEGTEFHKRYPRIFENFQHMVDSVIKHGAYKDPLGDH